MIDAIYECKRYAKHWSHSGRCAFDLECSQSTYQHHHYLTTTQQEIGPHTNGFQLLCKERACIRPPPQTQSAFWEMHILEP